MGSAALFSEATGALLEPCGDGHKNVKIMFGLSTFLLLRVPDATASALMAALTEALKQPEQPKQKTPELA